jgi:hypothetical protein
MRETNFAQLTIWNNHEVTGTDLKQSLEEVQGGTAPDSSPSNAGSPELTLSSGMTSHPYFPRNKSED